MLRSQCFVFLADISCRIKIVLELLVNQSHAMWFFFPSLYWLAINLAFRLNVIYIKHLLVQSVIQWLFYYYTNSRALGCVPALKEGKGLSFKISYLGILKFLIICISKNLVFIKSAVIKKWNKHLLIFFTFECFDRNEVWHT